jgi:hypothetical protein
MLKMVVLPAPRWPISPTFIALSVDQNSGKAI